jgi:hypothetical protein
VIALGVAVHAADALVEATDEARQVALGKHVGALREQIEAGGEVGLVGPLLAPERAGEEAFADMAYLLVGSEEAGFVAGHGRFLQA